MYWNKEMGWIHPPGLATPVEGQSGAADGGQTTHAANSFEADFMCLPFMSLGSAHFPQHDSRRDFQPYSSEGENANNRLSGYMDLNRLADSNTDANMINVKSDSSCHAIDRNNTVGADYLMNRASSSTDYLKSQVEMNFMPPRGETVSGYPMKACGAEAKTIRSQMSGNFSSLGCGTSLSPLANNPEAIRRDSTFSPFPSDGNFLSLGIGGGTEIRPNSNFSNWEIATKLEEAFLSQSNSSLVRQSPKDPLSRPARIQNNVNGLSSSESNLVSRMSTCYEGGPIRDTNARLNSIPFPSWQTPQANIRPGFIATSDNFEFDQNPSLPFPRNFPVHPECAASFPLGTQPTNPTYLASQSISNRQEGYHGDSYMNVSPQSSRKHFSERHRGSSISHAQLGKLTPFTEGIRSQTADGVLFPVSVQPVGNLAPRTEGTRAGIPKIGSFPSSVQQVGTSHNVSSAGAFGKSLFPERIGFQIPKGSTFQSAAGGPFPKRLGVQPHDFSTARTGQGNLHSTQDYGLVDYFQKPIRPPSIIGPPPMHSAASFRPLAKSGKVNPAANIDVRPRDSSIVSRPYLKRQATENPPIARPVHHRKIFPHHSVPHQGRNIPPTPIPETTHIPPDPLHVKWQGFDEPPKPTGHRCLLCKRDLSFTAEGPVYQPAIPPAVAVLPCGHTFHDHCLERITPKGHSKYPPCIPCAIGET
ncbi:hypothetical protein BUALT_Bualt07G0111100 [Buddleja alternifolia]|uniref:RING-type domain-containing protein n=1 Tax=Buddleja alternifolia TaxID=168488 RepID=A0AAV6XKR4_9LAMI|nr:hypothetical protein BUALT_Bualt07G0111100 [Buddleja alternifolia]